MEQTTAPQDKEAPQASPAVSAGLGGTGEEEKEEEEQEGGSLQPGPARQGGIATWAQGYAGDLVVSRVHGDPSDPAGLFTVTPPRWLTYLLYPKKNVFLQIAAGKHIFLA